jgi:hypothetical protein
MKKKKCEAIDVVKALEHETVTEIGLAIYFEQLKLIVEYNTRL